MYWFESLLTDEFIKYFENEESVYFSVNCGQKEYDKTFVKFRETVLCLFLAFIVNDTDKTYDQIWHDKESLEYKVNEIFFRDKRNLNFGAIYRTIGEGLYTCDLSALSCDQLAAGLMYPFASRMGGSFEDEFAESGRLREFVLALHSKYKQLQNI